MDDSIDKYLSSLDNKYTYPIIKDLLTHNSGYKAQLPFSKAAYRKMFYEIIRNKESTYKNPFIINSPDDIVLATINNNIITNKSYKFEYSNINYTVLGMIIKEINNDSYRNVMEKFISSELYLVNTNFDFKNVISGYTKKSELKRNWTWNTAESVIASVGLYSNAYDLLNFLKLQAEGNISYLSMTHNFIGLGTKDYHMDSGWKINKKDNIVWHNGGTGVFNTFMGFNQKTKKRVVILSNYRSLFIDRLGLSLLK